jgi:predicted CXXCH cytochrome family protein
MPTLTKRLLKPWVLVAALAAWSLLFVACETTQRTVVVPTQIAGAKYVGAKQCAECHAEVSEHFASATHAKLSAPDAGVEGSSCEACHGPGSKHVASGGGKGTMINPKKSPEACFQCHLDKRGQFSLPSSHPLLAGKITCMDCHEVHEGNAIKGTGAELENEKESCTKCHTAQKGPFIFEHAGLREGCTACHQPHGSVNQKMLLARDANLCLRCHLVKPGVPNAGEINANSIRSTTVNGVKVASSENHAGSRMMQGTCWVAGCHEAVHGSNVNNHMRR